MKTKMRSHIYRVFAALPLLLVLLSAAPLRANAVVPIDPSSGGSASSFDTSVDQHIDRSTILYQGQYYWDSQIDDNYTYYEQGDNDGCQDYINYLKSNNTQATLNVRAKDPTNGSCTDKKSTITLAYPERSRMPFDFIDQNTIVTSDKKNTYTFNTQVNAFLETGGDKCKDVIKVTAGPDDSGATLSVLASTNGNNTSYDKWDAELHFNKNNMDTNGDCTTYGPNNYQASTVYLNNADVLKNSPDASLANSTGGTSDPNAIGSSSGPDINCGGLSLNWILCPFEEGLTTAVRGIDAIINDLLQIDTKSIFSSCTAGSIDCQTSGAYKAAWTGMMRIALALLVIFALIMVISQAAGFDFIDAYTVRKVLPRLIIAAIGMTLSWQLLQFFVTFTNDLGRGIDNLIYAPFASLHQSITLGNGGAILGLLAGFLLQRLLGWALLTFIGTAALAVLIAVLVLIIRQVLIIFLIIIAPIAIAAYILPNTKKMYDIWWDFFSKALLMYPIIIAFIATGRVFASVSSTNASATGGVVGMIDSILAFIAYFAPYFLLPLTFRFAGGALGAIGGFVNDRGRGGFDRLRNIRANTQKRRIASAGNRARTGNIFRNAPRGTFRSSLNRGVQNASHLNEIGVNPNNWRGNLAAARSKNELDHLGKAAEHSAAFRAFQGNDDQLEAAQIARSSMSEARAYLASKGYEGANLDTAVGLIRQAQKDLGVEGLTQAAAVANWGTGTGLSGGAGQGLDSILKAADGNMAVATSMYAQARGNAERARRFDLLGGGFADGLGHMQSINEAKTVDDRQDAINNANEQSAEMAIETQGVGAIVGGRGQSGRNLAPAMQRRLQQSQVNLSNAMAGGNPDAIREAERLWIQNMASTSTAIDIAGQGAPEVARLLADTVHNGNVDLRQIPPDLRDFIATNPDGTRSINQVMTVSEVMERLERHPEFGQMKKTYASRYAADAAARGLPAVPGAPPGGPVPGAPTP